MLNLLTDVQHQQGCWKRHTSNSNKMSDFAFLFACFQHFFARGGGRKKKRGWIVGGFQPLWLETQRCGQRSDNMRVLCSGIRLLLYNLRFQRHLQAPPRPPPRPARGRTESFHVFSPVRPFFFIIFAIFFCLLSRGNWDICFYPICPDASAPPPPTRTPRGKQQPDALTSWSRRRLCQEDQRRRLT